MNGDLRTYNCGNAQLVSLSSVEAVAQKRKKRAKAGKKEQKETDSKKEGPPNKKSRQNESPFDEDSASRAPGTSTEINNSEQNEHLIDEDSAIPTNDRVGPPRGHQNKHIIDKDSAIPTNDRVGPPRKGKKKKIKKTAQPAKVTVPDAAVVMSPTGAAPSASAVSPSLAPNPPSLSAARAAADTSSTAPTKTPRPSATPVVSPPPLGAPSPPPVGALEEEDSPPPVGALEEEEEEEKLPPEPVSFPDDWDEDDGLTTAILTQDYHALAKFRNEYVLKACQTHATTVRRILDRFRFHLIALAVVPANRAYNNTLPLDTDTATSHQIAEYIKEIDPQGFWGVYSYHMYLLRELAMNMIPETSLWYPARFGEPLKLSNIRLKEPVGSLQPVQHQPSFEP
ncbi:hypothetical protein C8R42DRAFT_643545 [Lentinula raphanica]|nr:hypothetical protein C8R42DRAFT_643545 [Lentinula raphanica]